MKVHQFCNGNGFVEANNHDSVITLIPTVCIKRTSWMKDKCTDIIFRWLRGHVTVTFWRKEVR